MTRVIGLDHSGFVVDHGGRRLVFDWYRDPADVLAARGGRGLIYFVSHSHHDHWHDGVMAGDRRTVELRILDASCRTRVEALGATPEPAPIYVHPGQRLDLRLDDGTALRVHCLASTDEGVAFLILLGELIIYHAGDLNCWDWRDEDGPAARAAYEAELDRLAELLAAEAPGRRIDLAFVPVDRRLGDVALDGARLLLARTAPVWLLPMHLNGGAELPGELAAWLAAEGRAEATRVVDLSAPGASADYPM